VSEDKSSNELPEEVVQKIEDIVREFYDQLAEGPREEGNVYYSICHKLSNRIQ
jgi:hypothetical protein